MGVQAPEAMGAVPLSGRMRFLDRLDPVVAESLLDAGQTRRLADSEVLVAQGDAHGMVGIVIEGLVKVTSTDRDGHKVLLDVRGPGDLIGLVECCGATVRSSTVTCVGPTVVRLISCDALRAELLASPAAAAVAAEVLAERVGEAITYRLRAGRSVSSRLAQCLLMLARDYGTDRGDGAVEVSFPLSQDELAAFVDSSRDAVAKTLMRWRRMRLVETGRCSTVILDMERLADSATM